MTAEKCFIIELGGNAVKYKDGSEVQDGDVIRWNCWDNDDFTTWHFIGIKKTDHVVYMGGGIDFGSAIGKHLTLEEVIEESEDNDCDDRGITQAGSLRDFFRHVTSFPLAAGK